MRVSQEEFRKLMNGNAELKESEKKNKYNARKIKVDGIWFDSQAEADYYCQLKLLVQSGVIDGFCRQARFVVTAGDCDTKATEYVTDFVIFYPDKSYRIVDVKGMKTEIFKLKMKSLREKYPKLKIELE